MAKLFLICGLSLMLASTSIDGQLTDGLLKLTTPLQREVERHIDTQKRIIGTALGIDPDTKFSQIFPTIGSFNQSQIIECYNSSIGDVEFDIFKNTIFDAIKIYYTNFPENFELAKLSAKVKNFFQSLNEIGTHTVQCLANPTNYQLGITQLTDFSESEYKTLLGAIHDEARIVANFAERPVKQGERASRDESNSTEVRKEFSEEGNRGVNLASTEQGTGTRTTSSSSSSSSSTTTPPTSGSNSRSSNSSSLLNKVSGGLVRLRRQQVTVDPICFPKSKAALPDRFDWRSRGKVTPVRFQGSCGSCWAFASLAALESAYLIKGKTNNKKFDLSEQHLLGCARKNGCKGGTSVDAFNYILSNDGVTDEETLPYAKKEKCESGRSKRKVATVNDYCLRGVYAKVNGKPEQLTDEQIQRAIFAFGPVYSTINADHVAVKHLKGGVYNNKKCSKTTNHAILIVGWDKTSWLIKNSWGRKWADGGFFRMKRGQNMCGINTYITYPIL